MAYLSAFSTPAFIDDFAGQPALAKDMAWRWNINVSGWIEQATPGAPSFFYDPVQTDIPQGTAAAIVTWNAFPGRLQQFYSQNPPVSPPNIYKLTSTQIYQLADTGYYTADDGSTVTFQDIPATLCPQADWSGPLKTFGPYGPRGWLDEYCEWSVARNTDGNIVRVDFVCENPEYWGTLWKVDPETVRQIYETTLNYDCPPERQITVALKDLILTYDGNPVIDPDTGFPAYNPLNKWNSGPVSVRTGDASGFTGGAMHLTSTPNTLQTELGLAGVATINWASGNSNAQTLICCGLFGQQYRNSDPHIGQSVNYVVNGSTPPGGPFTTACLANPVGLYLQLPTNPAAFSFASRIDPSQLPSGAEAWQVWQVVRGSATVTDEVTGQLFNGNMVLHAVCQIPSSWLTVYPDMTLNDILINNVAITYAGQIAAQFNVGLYARPLPTSDVQATTPCASSASTPSQPLQCVWSSIWAGFYPQQEVAPTGQLMSLASNTTFIAPQLASGTTHALTLTCNTPSPSGTPTVAVLLADGSGPDTSISVTVSSQTPVTYAVPGNSYPGNYVALELTVMVPSGTLAGLRGIMTTDPDGTQSTLPAAIYLLGG